MNFLSLVVEVNEAHSILHFCTEIIPEPQVGRQARDRLALLLTVPRGIYSCRFVDRSSYN